MPFCDLVFGGVIIITVRELEICYSNNNLIKMNIGGEKYVS